MRKKQKNKTQFNQFKTINKNNNNNNTINNKIRKEKTNFFQIRKKKSLAMIYGIQERNQRNQENEKQNKQQQIEKKKIEQNEKKRELKTFSFARKEKEHSNTPSNVYPTIFIPFIIRDNQSPA